MHNTLGVLLKLMFLIPKRNEKCGRGPEEFFYFRDVKFGLKGFSLGDLKGV